MKLLDLFFGRGGWSKAFAACGWHCVGVDLVAPPEVPAGCEFIQADVLTLTAGFVRGFDFVCASSPCEQFSVHGMKHFHPNPKYPEMGIKLFNHTRQICEESGVPYVMENVRASQQFVGNAVHHCGPFYLFGNAVPPLMPQGISKGIDVGSSKVVKLMTKEERRVYRAQFPWNRGQRRKSEAVTPRKPPRFRPSWLRASRTTPSASCSKGRPNEAQREMCDAGLSPRGDSRNTGRLLRLPDLRRRVGPHLTGSIGGCMKRNVQEAIEAVRVKNGLAYTTLSPPIPCLRCKRAYQWSGVVPKLCPFPGCGGTLKAEAHA